MDQLQPPIQLCSKCGEDWKGCKCDQFHPNVVVSNSKEDNLTRLTFPPDYKGGNPRALVVIDEEQATQLLKFFMECGYISYEFYPKVHEFIDGHLKPYCNWLENRK